MAKRYEKIFNITNYKKTQIYNNEVWSYIFSNDNHSAKNLRKGNCISRTDDGNINVNQLNLTILE